MDSGNGNNQQQRYCPTPIMAPPSVATSPPGMSGASVMGGIHQQPTHHPPPSISPHPAAYYSHHSTGASHYPTPSPTPPAPSMHHQQYYGHQQHPYYTHGSHQAAQQTQTQQSHHGMSTHVGMSSPAAGPTTQTQHPHLMSHGSYHHPSQSQSHHQQWASQSHTHQQQPHHYYHQPTHHTPPQQQPQQHGYPPPPHSPYPYNQSHSAAPTPPPQQQQQLAPPPVPASPGPSQMHQAPPPQQSQSHALINLSRFVSQQSTSPSPRASPSLAHQHHQQQISQMGPHSPAPFTGHMEHHITMNGHSTMVTNSTPPIMSPPPPMAQAMSSPPPPIIPVQQHHLPPQSPNPYSVNGGGSVMDRHTHSPIKVASVSPDMTKHDFRKLEATNTKEQDLHMMFPEMSSGLCTKDSDNMMNSEPPPVSLASSNPNSNHSNSANNDLASIMNSNSSECSFPSSSPVRRDSIDSCNATTLPDIPRPNGSGSEILPKDADSMDAEHSSHFSVCPQAKSMGSPTNTGNGHQMMPVRLQNMQKGARTKASMKKLMQEQQISTPNGQASDISSDGGGIVGKDVEETDSIEVAPKGKGKGSKALKAKSPKRKKSATDIPDPNSVTVNQLSAINSDLSENDFGTMLVPPIVIRPGYTKSGKKIGRPRKDSLPADGASPTAKGKGKKAAKANADNKWKNSLELVESIPISDIDNSPTSVPLPLADPDQVTMQVEVVENQSRKKSSPKRKGAKISRKRVSKVLSDTSDLQETTTDRSSLVSPDMTELPVANADSLQDESMVTPVSPVAKGKKRSKSSRKSNITSPPTPPVTNAIEPVPTSEITEQTAKSVARSYIAPAKKGRNSKKKGSKISQPESSPEVSPIAAPIPKQKKGSPKKISINPISPLMDLDNSPERSDLPRLRSRSPKQNESPPLRVSSPRAAKERSTTPATTISSQRSSRASRSREKDVTAATTTPLASPALRSPKKTTEKAESNSRTRPSKTRQTNESLELQNEYLSPPPVKQTRQISKESSESGEVTRRIRKCSAEARASVDSDRSLSSVGKRTSRRKSGSVSGSTDRESLASPSFNQSTSALIALQPTGIFFETTPSELTSVSPSPVKSSKRAKQKKAPSLPVKRGKGKAAKPKSKSRKASAKSTKDDIAPVEPLIPPEENGLLVESESFEAPEVPVAAPPPETKRQKKPYVKKGKKTNNLFPVATAPGEYEEPLLDIDPPMTEVIGNTLPIKGKKGSKKSTKKSKQIEAPDVAAVLNIPEPLPTVIPPTKKRKMKLDSKQSKQSSKRPRKEEKAEVPSEKDPYQFDSSDLTATGSSASILSDDDSKVDTQFVFSPPPDLSLGRRRRSSAMSPVNTQASAKLSAGSGTESAIKVKSDEVSAVVGTSTPEKGLKLHRRDSRSLSREYSEVSVVLSDIARSPEFSSLSGLSPSVSDFLHSTPPPPQPAFSSSAIIPPVPKEPNTSQKLAATPLSSIVKPEDTATPSTSTKKPTKERKKKSSTDQEEEKPPPPQPKLMSCQMSFQERKANLEAEVAQVLLDLKSGSSGNSSKASSPAKSIPGFDLSDSPLSQSPKKRSKAGKAGKRRKSGSPRLSVDSMVNKQENIVPSISGEAASLEVDVAVTPTKKRKPAKVRRSSVKSKSRKGPILLDSAMDAYPSPNSCPSDVVAQSLNFSTQAPLGSSGKVNAKIAVIPTASSLGIPEPLPSPIAAPPNKVKVKKPREKKENPVKRKMSSTTSPDITALCAYSASTSSSEITATSTPISKRKKKSVKAEVKVEELAGQNQSVSFGVAEPMTESSAMEDQSPAVKKKRQRKPKVSAIVSEPVPSTSAAAAAMLIPGTSSQLFPYQTDPVPYKKPTVFTKSVPIVQSGKADDNQKNKAKDGPSIRVLGGIAKFYRGGEEEDVDQDPKLPKEKGQLPTDNAVPWICSFCHLGPHAQKLGDLFGPYFANLPPIYGTSPKRETWMHGDCALWAGRLILIGTYLRRLEETLVDADKETCTICKRIGATIGCLRRGCKEAVHYPCAIRKFWKMDEQNFHSYCPKHSS